MAESAMAEVTLLALTLARDRYSIRLAKSRSELKIK